MRQAVKYVFTLMLVLLGFSILAKVSFLLYNSNIYQFSISEALQVLLHGLAMDISVAMVVACISWPATVLALFYPKMQLRMLLSPWYVFLSFWVSLIYWGDVNLYKPWGFKLNWAVFSYMSSPGEGTASLTWWFLISRTLLLVGSTAVLSALFIRLTPKQLPTPAKSLFRRIRHILLATAAFLLLASTFWLLPDKSPLHGYFSKNLFLNHATQNPLFTLTASGIESNKAYYRQFQLLSPAQETEYIEGLYPDTYAISDTLLRTTRPNVLVVLVESQSSLLLESLGGLPGITPCQDSLLRDGILFDQLYANSFRTDRGVVSAISGHISYPSTSLMLQSGIRRELPSLAHSLSRAGYTTEYIYGGNLQGMQAGNYLRDVGYERQTDMYDLAPRGQTIVTAAPDSLSAAYVARVIRRKRRDEKWHLVYQTITSHEPFDAPSRRLENDTLNAFAYTDAAIGLLVDSLRADSALWDNLLMVVLSDHGCMFRRNYSDNNYFHIPMIWGGGALRYHGKRISVIMNQSDMPATLLAQMRLPNGDYLWSRNVLSPSYSHPSAYCTWPAGYLFVDSTGVSAYDLYAGFPFVGGSSDQGERRLQHGRAILQSSYRQLQDMADEAK